MRLRRNAKVKLLERIPLFHDCSQAELELVAGLAKELKVDGGTLLREGTVGHEFVILVEGQAQVVEGGRPVAAVRPGDYVGEISLVGQTRRTASVVATGPVHALTLDEEAFRRVLAEVPSVRAKVNHTAFDRLARERPEQPTD